MERHLQTTPTTSRHDVPCFSSICVSLCSQIRTNLTCACARAKRSTLISCRNQWPQILLTLEVSPQFKAQVPGLPFFTCLTCNDDPRQDYTDSTLSRPVLSHLSRLHDKAEAKSSSSTRMNYPCAPPLVAAADSAETCLASPDPGTCSTIEPLPQAEPLLSLP